MRYEGDIYRPPSEAYSLLLQVTVGCTHNKCTFCSMYKDKKFHLRRMDEVIEDLEDARKSYKYVERIFLCDGDALCLSNEKLMIILKKIQELFPECKRVNVYGRANDVLHQTPDELKEHYENGGKMIYLGAESGIKASVTFISGIAGKAGWREHAVKTGEMISKMNASYVALLTLMLDPRASIMREVESGELELLTPEEIVAETYLMMEHMNPTKPVVFRSNHASNYLSLRGNLPEDKQHMMGLLKKAMEDICMLNDERFRML